MTIGQHVVAGRKVAEAQTLTPEPTRPAKTLFIKETLMAIPESRMGNMETSRTARPYFNGLDWIAMTLLIIGGLNWGLIGLFDVNLIALIFGEMTALSRIIYALVGLAAVYDIYLSFKVNRRRHLT